MPLTHRGPDPASIQPPEREHASASRKLYHGSATDFAIFDPSKIGSGVGGIWEGQGVYLTESIETAAWFAREAETATQSRTGVVKPASIGKSHIFDFEHGRLDPRIVRGALEAAGCPGVLLGSYREDQLHEPELMADLLRYAKKRPCLCAVFAKLGYDGIRRKEQGFEPMRRKMSCVPDEPGYTTIVFDPGKVDFGAGVPWAFAESVLGSPAIEEEGVEPEIG